MEGSTEAVRLAVYWGNTLINVSQVDDPRKLTAQDVFGQAITAVGVAPDLKLFSNDVSKPSRLKLGALTLVAEPVTAPERVSTITPPEDYTFFKIAMMTGLAMIAVLVSFAITPGDVRNDDQDIIGDVVRIIRQQNAQTVDLRKKLPASDKARAKGDEGKTGPKDAALNQAPKENLLTKKPKTSTGKMLLEKIWGSPALGAVFAPGVVNDKVEQGLNGLQNPNAQLGDSRGFNGMGARHEGGGGGDKNGLELGSLGTKRDGKPNSFGINLGTGKKPTIVPPAGPIRITDGLSKDVIAKVIKRHQSEIKACYDNALNRDPELSGKVAVSFTIDPLGEVAHAAVAESTLNNATAEDCMLSRIRRWKFPEPLGGGVVDVNFPWVFTSAGTSVGE